MNAPDPVKLEVYKHLFQAVAEEMGETLRRTGFSPNIKERRDYSCAVFDAQGLTVAQAEHMPVHLGSMPESVSSALRRFTLEPGDVVMLNDPYEGGTHLPDVTLVQGVFVPGQDRAAFYVANRAHHADIGGISPGSLPLATELYQEGIIVPPVRLCRHGVLDEDLLELFLRNVRTPVERRGDLMAQLAANAVGARRLLQYVADEGLEAVTQYARALQDYAERMTRRVIAAMPDGTYTCADVLDDDGQGTRDVLIHVRVTVAGDRALVDFTGSSDQVPGNVNAVRAITHSATFYAFRAVVEEDIPSNAGGFRPLTVITRPGSVVDAVPAAAVAAGNVETSQRIVDVLLGALAQALPDRVPAAGQGTMNNTTFGGRDDRGDQGRAFAYYETIGGGAGAGPGWDGTSAVHVHMSNTLNTPVEAFERALPIRIVEHAIRRGSGGAGLYRGGDGIVRTYAFLVPTQVTLVAERRRHAPFGLNGGEPGKPGGAWLKRSGGATWQELPGKWHGHLLPGDLLRVETPGGGGWGRP